MAVCPKCNGTVQENYSTECPKCGASLAQPFFKNTNEEEPVLLCSAKDEMEAEVIISLLRSCEIPATKKLKGAGGYLSLYMGYSLLGADIYVRATQLEEAQKLLEESAEVEAFTADESALNGQSVKRRRNAIIALCVLLPGILLLFLTVLFGALATLRSLLGFM